MIKVLFVCHGNICRSPMAEFIFKDMLARRGMADKFYVASAATSTEEIWNGIGNPVYPPAKRELAKHGISCEGKRAVQLQRTDYDKYDYLIGMEERNRRNMLRILGSDQEERSACCWITPGVTATLQIRGIPVISPRLILTLSEDAKVF